MLGVPAPQSDASSGNPARGIAFMIGATLMFSLADMQMKLAASVLPTTETMFFRSFVATLVVAVFAAYYGHFHNWRSALSRAMALRAGGDAGASLLFQSALARMPFADIMAVLQLQTLSLTAGSALFLGETVGWRRWTAVAVGMIGGLLIIKPGTSAFNWWAIAAFGCVLFATAREIATRKISPLAPVPVIMVISSGVVTLASLAGAVLQDWSVPHRLELAMMIGAGFFSAAGQFCMISSVRSAPLSVVSPFRYASMIWAILIGYAIWRQIPDSVSFVGIGAIAGAGLYTFHRERKLQLARRSAKPLNP